MFIVVFIIYKYKYKKNIRYKTINSQKDSTAKSKIATCTKKNFKKKSNYVVKKSSKLHSYFLFE